MIDIHLARAARGAVMEAAGTLLRNEQLADRGRLEQYRHLRRRQVQHVRANWRDLPIQALPSLSERVASTLTGGRRRD